MSRGLVSIRDVARMAGVSLSTVSQALNDNAAARISEETRVRVKRVAAELGYRPNKLARSLISGRTDTIGLMVSGLRNPLYVNVLETAERLVMEAGYQAMLDTAPSWRGSYSQHGRLNDWPVDGILMWALADQNAHDFISGLDPRTPIVYLGGSARADGSEHVGLDVVQGALQAATAIAERGVQKVAYAVPYPFGRDGLPAEDRHQAVTTFFGQRGVVVETLLLPRQEETQAAGRELGLLLAKRSGQLPEVVFCHNDVIAIGLYHGLRRTGVRVPEDVAIVGFDGIEEGQVLDKPLSTVRIPVDELCQSAVTFLIERLREPARAVQQHLVGTIYQPGETT